MQIILPRVFVCEAHVGLSESLAFVPLLSVQVLSSIGLEMDDELRGLFSKFDGDGDGRMSFVEFNVFWQDCIGVQHPTLTPVAEVDTGMTEVAGAGQGAMMAGLLMMPGIDLGASMVAHSDFVSASESFET